MKEELFNEPLESLHEGGAILRHEKTPSRKFAFQELDVQKIRSIFRLSQKEFAAVLGVSPDTLRSGNRGDVSRKDLRGFVTSSSQTSGGGLGCCQIRGAVD